MANCDLTIELDQEQTHYRPGDVVSGAVMVDVDGDVQCDGLKLELRWKTHGKGNSVHEVITSQELLPQSVQGSAQERWRPGTTQRYPFTVEIPAGPYTYHGHYLNVVWELKARADIPWALDPKAEREIAVQADPERPADWHTAVATPDLLPPGLKASLQGPADAATPSNPEAPPVAKWIGNALGIGCLMIFVVPMLVLLGVAVYQAVAFARGQIPLEEGLIWSFIGLVLLLLLGVGGFKALRKRIAQKKLGEVTYEVNTPLLRAGGEVTFHVSCQPQERTELLGARARLQAQEVVVRGSGTNKTTYRKVVHEQEVEIATARSLQPRMPFQAHGAFTLPADAPPSFSARSNALRWSLILHLDIARWPDWVEERAILVHP